MLGVHAASGTDELRFGNLLYLIKDVVVGESVADVSADAINEAASTFTELPSLQQDKDNLLSKPLTFYLAEIKTSHPRHALSLASILSQSIYNFALVNTRSSEAFEISTCALDSSNHGCAGRAQPYVEIDLHKLAKQLKIDRSTLGAVNQCHYYTNAHRSSMTLLSTGMPPSVFLATMSDVQKSWSRP